MTQELELKAVVPDPGALRARLANAGAVPGFRGLMTDCRYDRDGALIRRDEGLRVRSYRPLSGTALGGAVLRLERYLRMDVLVEVEGAPAQIEAAILATGLPRDGFSADALIEFVRRYEPRTGRTAALAVADLRGEASGWEAA